MNETTTRTIPAALEIAMLRSLIREKNIEITSWQPLADVYESEMRLRRQHGFLVETLDVWVRDLARRLGGVCVEDPGAVADRHEDYGQDG
jgi:hypothetical protein